MEQCNADREIHEWSREKQAEYADMVMVAIADDPDLCRKVGVFTDVSKEKMASFDSCAIGGLSYLALHSPDAQVREQCEQRLVAITAAKREAPRPAPDQCTLM